MTSTPAGPLPGEDAPLAMRPGGAPITPEEALGVARRVARARGRLVRLDAVDELPREDATLVPAAYRLPPRLLHPVRAKAEMEGRSVTAVLTEALQDASDSPAASSVRFRVLHAGRHALRAVPTDPTRPTLIPAAPRTCVRRRGRAPASPTCRSDAECPSSTPVRARTHERSDRAD